MGQVFITELADPNNLTALPGTRYIELYNAGASTVDFTDGTGWLLNKYTNGSLTVSQTLSLTGTISADGFYIIATGTDDGDFSTVYGVSADQFDGGDNNVAGANGDDTIELVDGDETTVDLYGTQPITDLTSTVWEFEDGRAERATGATSGKNPPVDADWNTWSDGSGGDVIAVQDAPANFDPGAWIGATNPTITLSTTTLTDFSYIIGGGPSTEKTFTVEGSDLTENITLTAPTNYEISESSGSGFTNSITLTQDAGTVSSTTIYTRLNAGLTAGDYNSEAISATSTGATSKSVTCSGTVYKLEPTNHVTGFTATANGASTIDLVWAENDGTVIPDGYIIMANIDVITAPGDGTDPSDDTDLTDDSGNIKVAHGVTSYSFNNCSPATAYNLEIYPYTNSGTAINFKTDATIPADNATTGAAAAEPGIGDLVITEVSGEDANGTSDDGFIEIYNTTSQELSLANVSARYYNTNPGDPNPTVALFGSIAAGEFKIVTRNEADFLSEYGFVADFADDIFYCNGGDDGVDLYHSSNGTLDQFNEVGTGTSPWIWINGSVYERTNSGSGAIQSNWTEYAAGTGTPKALLLVSWDGSTDDDWNTAGNWDKIIPGSYQNVNIPTGETPVISSTTSANCYDLTLEGSATLNINSDESNNGSLIVGGTSSGNITYNRYMTGVDKWHLISSPVGAQSVNSFVTNGSNAIATNSTKYGLAPYNNSTPAWEHFTTSNTPGNFDAGKGYEVLRTSSGSVAFTGTVATSSVSIGITENTNSWNLVGNPYPSAISGNNPAAAVNNFIAVNTAALHDSYEAIYVWNPASSTYLTVNHTYLSNTAFYVAPGQAFFVYSVVGGSSVSFTEAMQDHQTAASFYKNDYQSIPTLKLMAAKDDRSTATTIKYIEGTTTGLDRGYDAGRITVGDNSFAIYTHLVGDNENLIDFDIQCLPNNDFENMVVPVGLNAPEGSEIIFNVELTDFPTDLYVYLEDREKGEFTNLDESNSKYSIYTDNEISGIGRFYLHTVQQELTSINEGVESEIYRLVPQPSNGILQIRGQIDEDTKLTLYNIAGQSIGEFWLNRGDVNEIVMPAINSGIYLALIQSQSNSRSIKFLW